MGTGSTKNQVGRNQWQQNHISIFDSALKAITGMLPPDKQNGLEIQCESVSFTGALGIPRLKMPNCAAPQDASTRLEPTCDDKIPFENLSLDYILLSYCNGFGGDLNSLFKEAHRVLKTNGMLIVAFIDSMSPAGKKYVPHETAKLRYDTERITFDLTHAGFKHFEFCQTLLSDPGTDASVETPREGYGEGAFVVVQARKKVLSGMR